MVRKRQRAGARAHSVRRIDVRLQDDRDTVQGPTRARFPAFFVERAGDSKRIGVDFNHRVQRRPGTVDAFDPIDIDANQLLGIELATVET